MLPTNKHQLMKRLARRNRVLYLETLGTRTPRLGSGTDVRRIARRVRRGFEGPRRRESHLWTLSPLVRPAWDTPLARAANRAAFRAQTGATLARFPNPIAWVYSPYAVYLLDLIQPRAVVYHMVDDLSAVPGANARAIAEAERRLLARADCVFCTERSLHDRAKAINPRALYLHNVADFRHFSKATPNVSDKRFESLRTMRPPRVVFSGNLAPHKVDLGLIVTLAAERRDWSFVLIGPPWEGADSGALMRRLNALPNVEVLGHVAYEQLPAYLHEADVLIIPYVRNKATRAVFPLKFFEYLATGKPVVASPLPSLLPYEPAVYLAEKPKQWIAAIERALADNGVMREQRIALARRQTWGVRLREMEREICAML